MRGKRAISGFVCEPDKSLKNPACLGCTACSYHLVIQHHTRQLLAVYTLPDGVREQAVHSGKHSRAHHGCQNAAEQQIRRMAAEAAHIQQGQAAPVCLQDGFPVQQNHDGSKNGQDDAAGGSEQQVLI